MSVGQVEQLAAPIEKKPAAQLTHGEALDAIPDAELVDANVPAGQLTQTDADAPEYDPGRQFVQTEAAAPE